MGEAESPGAIQPLPPEDGADDEVLRRVRPEGPVLELPFAELQPLLEEAQPLGRRLALASVHFSAGDTPARRDDRVAQWSWLVAALPELRGEWAAPVIVAGDFNSTGYLVDGDPERRFIDALVEQHALQLPTAGLACSMYWQRSKTTFAVSLLDHVLAPGDLSFGPAEALGICAELACAPQTAAPTAWVAVSDHCPVRVPLKF